MDINPIYAVSSGQISQPFQGRPDQGRTGIAVIYKLPVRRQWYSVVGDALSQGRKLTLDGLSISLLLAGDAGVNGGLNRLHACFLLAASDLTGTWVKSRVALVRARVMATIRSYASARQSELIREGSKVTETSRGL